MKTMKRKGPGRPRLMSKTRRIIIQIDDAQLKEIQQIRRDKNISVSQFLRTAAEYYLTNAQHND
jgi:hypothetical protein